MLCNPRSRIGGSEPGVWGLAPMSSVLPTGTICAMWGGWDSGLPASVHGSQNSRFRFGFLVHSVHDNFPKLFDTLFSVSFFFRLFPFYSVSPKNSPRKSKMSAEKAPLPFGYTFMAGEHIPSNPRAQPRSLAPLTMVTEQALLPVFPRRVAQLTPMLAN